MNHLKELATKKLNDLKGMLEYASKQASDENIDSVDKKEFLALVESLKNELQEHQDHMNFCESEGYYA